MSGARSLIGLAAAAVVGGVAGSLATIVLAPGPRAGPGPAAAGAGAPERILALERRVEVVERRRDRTQRPVAGGAGDSTHAGFASPGVDGPDGGRPGGGRPDVGGPGGGGPNDPTAALDPDPDFVRAVEGALRQIEERKRAEDAQAARDEQREKFLREVDRLLRSYQERLGITDDQIADVSRIATAAIDARQAAQQRGVSGEELGAMDRAMSRRARDVLGADTYREFRALELDRRLRPTIADVASRAGVDAAQRGRIEGLIKEHIQRVVDPEVRLRTEDLPPESREALRQEIQDLNQDTWRRLREDVLTPEQRDRIPDRP